MAARPISADGKHVLTPGPEFHGQETFTVDGEFTATITVSVNEVMADDTFNVEQNSRNGHWGY